MVRVPKIYVGSVGVTFCSLMHSHISVSHYTISVVPNKERDINKIDLKKEYPGGSNRGNCGVR